MAERGTSDPAKSHPEAAYEKHHDKESPGEKFQSHSVFNSIAEAIHPKKNSDELAKTKEADHQGSSPSKKGFLHSHHLHHPKHKKETHGRSDDIDENTKVEDVKGPNVFQRVKEEVEAVAEAIHLKKDSSSSSPAKGSPHRHHHQHKEETHGRSDDIDELTSVEDVKGPNVFSRMKEEVEAVVEAIHPKKDSSDEHK